MHLCKVWREHAAGDTIVHQFWKLHKDHKARMEETAGAMSVEAKQQATCG